MTTMLTTRKELVLFLLESLTDHNKIGYIVAEVTQVFESAIIKLGFCLYWVACLAIVTMLKYRALAASKIPYMISLYRGIGLTLKNSNSD